MEITIVLVILFLAVVLFATEVLAIDLIAILMLLGLTLTGVLSVKEGLSGFSDPAVITIAGFFVISSALFNTGVVEAIGRRIHRVSGSNSTTFLIVLMLTAAALASFLSNVVTTAVLMPAVFAISRRLKEPVSKFLMPLSFAAVLGGKCTLVGSPTNLAINGLLTSNYDKYHIEPFTLFDFTPIGIPLVIAGIIYMLVLGKRLLPKHDTDEFDHDYGSKEFVTEVVILPNSPLSNKTLAEVDFRGTYDLQILGIVRGEERMLPHRDSKLEPNDILLVKGKLDQILKIKDEQGLDIKSDRTPYNPAGQADAVIVEAILSPNSTFAGRTLKEIRFGSRYRADVLAIYRHHHALHEKLSDIRLKFGDVLVIQGSSENIDQLRSRPEFPDARRCRTYASQKKKGDLGSRHISRVGHSRRLWYCADCARGNRGCSLDGVDALYHGKGGLQQNRVDCHRVDRGDYPARNRYGKDGRGKHAGKLCNPISRIRWADGCAGGIFFVHDFSDAADGQRRMRSDPRSNCHQRSQPDWIEPALFCNHNSHRRVVYFSDSARTRDCDCLRSRQVQIFRLCEGGRAVNNHSNDRDAADGAHSMGRMKLRADGIYSEIDIGR